MKSLAILVATVLISAAAFSAAPAVAEVDCSRVLRPLMRACIDCGRKPSSSVSSLPCCPPRGGGGMPVRNLKKMAQSPEDKSATCECVKQFAAGKYWQAIEPDVAAQLAELCAMEISVPKDTHRSKRSAGGGA